MPLSDENRAMLQLLLERGQGYDDIGSLLGIGVDEVRSRAAAALREICGEDPDREVALTDYLLGQADPIARADAARHLRADPDANRLASKLCDQLRLIAPTATLPEISEPRGAVPGGRPASGAASAGEGTPPESRASGGSQRWMIAALAAGALALLLVVLAVTGVFGGSGSPPGSAAGSASGQDITKAVLSGVGEGSGGRGVVIFGRVRKVPVLQVTAVGLDRAPAGSDYYVWLYRSGKLALRVGGFRVDGRGRALTQIRVPTEAIALVASGVFDKIDVTLTRNAAYRAALASARRQRRLPALTGTSVLRGPITGPIAEAGRRAAARRGAGG
ncbi:MAG: hypothetical protein U0R52_13625 [Solirubrobacterales bacterium]